MSNFKAIATVTAALRTLLDDIKNEVNGTQIISRPPAGITVNQNDRFLNLYLYYINSNSGFNSYNQPYRNSSGQLIQKPLLALNLHYLLTAYTNDNEEIISQQILGSAMRILNEMPLLAKELIRTAIQANLAEDLLDSNLADQIESVKFTFHSLSIDEITKLWSSFFHQTGYRTSVSYLATVILIEGQKVVTSEQLPVRDRHVEVFPTKKPILEKVEKENV